MGCPQGMVAAQVEARDAGRRRGKGEDAIYFDASKNCYIGAVSLGFGGGGRRVRRKVRGKTKAEVRAKLKALHGDLDVRVTRPPDSRVTEGGTGLAIASDTYSM